MTDHRRVAAFSIPGHGHVNRMLPLVAGLCARGIAVDFFAHEMSRGAIERTGARFVNIYDGRDMDVPDAESLPLPMRNVSFAGFWADDVVREVAALRPGLILHDTFAVIARVAAFHLKLPRVNMRAGHNVAPAKAVAALEASGAVRISDACRASVETLRARHGVHDASPYCFLADHTADLNICSEPPEFLPAEDRRTFESLAFFGSYWPDARLPLPAEPLFGDDADSCVRVLMGMGTAAMLMVPELALELAGVVAEGLASYPNTRGLISLGSGLVPPAAVSHLQRPGVRVEPFVDQIAALGAASIFITHNGLNSTHEAVMHGVPMISYPLFGDQPGMAARCQQLGLSVPLGRPGTLPSVDDVHRALDIVRADTGFTARLARAREWELAVMAQRPQVLDRVIKLIVP